MRVDEGVSNFIKSDNKSDSNKYGKSKQMHRLFDHVKAFSKVFLLLLGVYAIRPAQF